MCSLNKAHKSAAIPVLLAATALAASACGGGGGTPADAGADAPLDTGADTAPADGGVDVAPLACDPAAQDCPAAQKCDFRCQGNTAVVDCGGGAGGGAIGSTCSTTTMPCARGSGCISMPSGGG